jgi:rhodanese-related sulfurtransferase
MKPANIIGILLVSLALAGYTSWAQKVKEGGSEAPTLAGKSSVAGIPLFSLKEAESLWRNPSTRFIEVRSPEDYEAGHLPGAFNLPDDEFEQRFPQLKGKLERAATLVTYCKSVDCAKSLWCAIRLRNKGLLQTGIYPYGWNDWVTHGLPVTGGTP